MIVEDLVLLDDWRDKLLFWSISIRGVDEVGEEFNTGEVEGWEGLFNRDCGVTGSSSGGELCWWIKGAIFSKAAQWRSMLMGGLVLSRLDRTNVTSTCFLFSCNALISFNTWEEVRGSLFLFQLQESRCYDKDEQEDLGRKMMKVYCWKHKAYYDGNTVTGQYARSIPWVEE